MTAEELKSLGCKVANRDKRNLLMISAMSVNSPARWFDGREIVADANFLDVGFIDTIRFGLGDAFYGGNVKNLGRCSFMKGCYLCVKKRDEDNGYTYLGMIIDLKEIDSNTLTKLGSKVEIISKEEYTGSEDAPPQPKDPEGLPFADEPDEGVGMDYRIIDGEYVCGVCGKACKSLAGLKKHLTTHGE